MTSIKQLANELNTTSVELLEVASTLKISIIGEGAQQKISTEDAEQIRVVNLERLDGEALIVTAQRKREEANAIAKKTAAQTMLLAAKVYKQQFNDIPTDPVYGPMLREALEKAGPGDFLENQFNRPETAEVWNLLKKMRNKQSGDS